MGSRFPTQVVVLVAAVVALAGSFVLFAHGFGESAKQVTAVKNARSVLHVDYVEEHQRGPIAREEWKLDDVDGVSRASYAATDRAGGRKAHFEEDVRGYNVSFAFGKLVQDGAWDLESRAPRGANDTFHVFTIAQTDGEKSGSHTFHFTDAKYLATTAGREYHITLSKDKPVPDILSLKSSAVADDRYTKIVADVHDFGSTRFKRTVEEARRKLLAAR